MLQTRPIWTDKLVRSAILDAYRTLGRTTSWPGHKSIRAAWPDYKISAADYAEQVIAGNFKGKRVRLGATAQQITHMEIVLTGWRDEVGHHHAGWMAGPLLGYPEHREMLLSWVRASLVGVSTTQMCREMGWPLATFKRKRDVATGIICDRLNRAGLRAW